MRISDRFIWITIVSILFVFWWLFTMIQAPWWIISIVIALGVLTWLQTHESTPIERYYLLLLLVVVMSTLYHRHQHILPRGGMVKEGYANGPDMSRPKEPNMKVSDLESQIQDLEAKLATASHHPETQNKTQSALLSQFLSTSSKDSAPRKGASGIQSSDLASTIGKDEKKLPSDDAPLDQYTPAQAQRATFQLVNTVQQLKETMENLGPVLKEGQQVMTMFEDMNLGDAMNKLETMGDLDETKEQMSGFMDMMKSAKPSQNSK